MATDITVYILEGDDSVGCALARLMKSAGYRYMRFSSLAAFETHDEQVRGRALVLADTTTVRGTDDALPAAWRLRDAAIPVIYLAREGSDAARKEAERVGAAGCFRKPVDRLALLDAIAFSARIPEPVPGQSGTPTDERSTDLV